MAVSRETEGGGCDLEFLAFKDVLAGVDCNLEEGNNRAIKKIAHKEKPHHLLR